MALYGKVGAAVARVQAEITRIWVALIASSSWSPHAFLSPKNGYLWPDHEGDRILFDAVSRADYGTWKKRTLAEMEFSGQHEMLNWMCLIGAMEALDRKPVIQDYMETHILASDKCFLSASRRSGLKERGRPARRFLSGVRARRPRSLLRPAVMIPVHLAREPDLVVERAGRGVLGDDL